MTLIDEDPALSSPQGKSQNRARFALLLPETELA
jgi:hypothetical protein